MAWLEQGPQIVVPPCVVHPTTGAHQGGIPGAKVLG